MTWSGTVAGEVSVEGGRITAVGPVGSVRDGGGVVDLGRRWLSPGYIDGHVHGGGGGAQCNSSDPDEITAVAKFHAGHGTTALLATTVAAPADELCRALAAIARGHGRRGGAEVLGAHLEGPFLSRRPGAMDPGTFLDPDSRTARRLLEADRGTVRMMTLAPELPGALGVVLDDELNACGTIVGGEWVHGPPAGINTSERPR